MPVAAAPGITIDNMGNGVIRIGTTKFIDPNGITSYKVNRGTSPGGESNLASGQTLPYVDKTGVLNQIYYYTLNATNGSGDSAASAEVYTVLTETRDPNLRDANKGNTPLRIASANADTLLLSRNPARQGFTITNESTAVLYILFGTGVASATNYSIQITGSVSAPFLGVYTSGAQIYTGMIRGFWAAANGFAEVQELER